MFELRNAKVKECAMQGKLVDGWKELKSGLVVLKRPAARLPSAPTSVEADETPGKRLRQVSPQEADDIGGKPLDETEVQDESEEEEKEEEDDEQKDDELQARHSPASAPSAGNILGTPPRVMSLFEFGSLLLEGGDVV